MTADTIPTARMKSGFTLRQPATGRAWVVDPWQWGIALHLAALGGWRPRGTLLTHPTGETSRESYLATVGQQLEGEDAAALAAGLTVAVERFLALSPAERMGAEHAVRVPVTLALTDAQHRNAGTAYGAPVAPFAELLALLDPERHLAPEATRTVRGLRRLAEVLATGDFTLEAGTPAGWYPPDTPTRTVKVKRAPGRPERINVGGRDAGEGDLVLVTAEEAASLVAAGSAEYAGEAAA